MNGQSAMNQRRITPTQSGTGNTRSPVKGSRNESSHGANNSSNQGNSCNAVKLDNSLRKCSAVTVKTFNSSPPISPRSSRQLQSIAKSALANLLKVSAPGTGPPTSSSKSIQSSDWTDQSINTGQQTERAGHGTNTRPQRRQQRRTSAPSGYQYREVTAPRRVSADYTYNGCASSEFRESVSVLTDADEEYQSKTENSLNLFRLSLVSVDQQTADQAPGCEFRESIISVLSDGYDSQYNEENVPTQSLRSKPISSPCSGSFIPVELTAVKSDPGLYLFDLSSSFQSAASKRSAFKDDFTMSGVSIEEATYVPEDVPSDIEEEEEDLLIDDVSDDEDAHESDVLEQSIRRDRAKNNLTQSAKYVSVPSIIASDNEVDDDDESIASFSSGKNKDDTSVASSVSSTGPASFQIPTKEDEDVPLNDDPKKPVRRRSGSSALLEVMAAMFGKKKSNVTEGNDGDLIVDFGHKKHKRSQSHDGVFETIGRSHPKGSKHEKAKEDFAYDFSAWEKRKNGKKKSLRKLL